MKAILEFLLPEEQHEYYEASNGQKYSIALFDIREKCIRAINKGHEYTNCDEVFEAILKMIPELEEE